MMDLEDLVHTFVNSAPSLDEKQYELITNTTASKTLKGLVKQIPGE